MSLGILATSLLKKELGREAMEYLCQMIGVESHQISKEEKIIIEAELFCRVCEALKEIFKTQYTEYFRLMKFSLEMENTMLEENFIRCVINDIVSSEEYSLTGIAYYTQTPEDVIYDIASGINVSPSLPLSRKIINLHRTIRPALYRDILKKVTTEKTS